MKGYIYEVETSLIEAVIESDDQDKIERYSQTYDSDVYGLSFTKNELHETLKTTYKTI